MVLSKGTGGCGSCGNSLPMICIGEFIDDVCLSTLVDRMIEIENLFKNGVPLTTTMIELVRSIMVFDSLTVKMDPDVGVGQACTFHIEGCGMMTLGMGASHFKSMPIYANMIQQVPTYGLYKTLTALPMMPIFPTTTGQFELQINPFATPFLVAPAPITVTGKADIVAAFNLLPLFSKLMVKKGTPIYQGFI